MKKIYTGIDLGSYSIKVIVCEVVNHKFHVLAASNTRCKGIKNGIVVDSVEAKSALLKAKQDVEKMLGFSIREAIVTVPSYDRQFDIIEKEISFSEENHLITAEDIGDIFDQITEEQEKEERKVVAITPISFQNDKKETVQDPKGMISNHLFVKAVVTSIPKENLTNTISLLQECNIQAIDVTLGAIGDYYESKNSEMDSKVSAIINIGYSKTEVSIFNKGIMIKNEIITEGSKTIDQELTRIYQIKKGQARKLKEHFAVSNTRYSDINDTIELVNKEGKMLVINQLEVSEIVEARLSNILKQAKKEINVLTNREISYIIITGGISELAGFEYVVENIFDRRCSTLNISTMGIRSNMYSSSYGIIKYFHDKLDFRGLSYSMVSEKEANSLVSTDEKVSNKNRDNILSTVFGYFSGE